MVAGLTSGNIGTLDERGCARRDRRFSKTAKVLGGRFHFCDRLLRGFHSVGPRHSQVGKSDPDPAGK
jgi:hypothetical protein